MPSSIDDAPARIRLFSVRELCRPSLDYCASPFSVPSPGDRSTLPAEPTSPADFAGPRTDEEVAAHPALHPQGNPANSRPPLLASAWYSTKDVASRLRIDASTLRRWRTAQPPQGPPFVSISERVVMYSAADIEEWLHSRRITPTQAA